MVGSVLQEMAKRQELAPMLLNRIRITRKKEATNNANGDEKQNDKDSQSKPLLNGMHTSRQILARPEVSCSAITSVARFSLTVTSLLR